MQAQINQIYKATLAEIQQLYGGLRSSGKSCLAIVHGDDAASRGYLKSRMKLALELGVEVMPVLAPRSPNAFYQVISELGHNIEVDGIIIDRPYPEGCNSDRLNAVLNPLKDVEGIHPYNYGRIVYNDNRLVPPTALAAKVLLDALMPVKGKHVVIIGRSLTVGLPLSLILTNADATVTLAHRQTANLHHLTKAADAVVVAAGQAELFDHTYFNPGVTIIDCGYHINNGVISGDVNKNVASLCRVTPVPGGVGPFTTLMLFKNLYYCYQLRRQREAVAKH